VQFADGFFDLQIATDSTEDLGTVGIDTLPIISFHP